MSLYEEALDPEIFISQMVYDYEHKLIPTFKSILKEFLYLKKGEEFIGENMSIFCLGKQDKYGQANTFLWNHFQNGYVTYIEWYSDDAEEYIKISSSQYSFPESFTRSYLVHLKSSKMFEYYIDLYYMISWMEQLVSNKLNK